jgi:hypothetical protein
MSPNKELKTYGVGEVIVAGKLKIRVTEVVGENKYKGENLTWDGIVGKRPVAATTFMAGCNKNCPAVSVTFGPADYETRTTEWM